MSSGYFEEMLEMEKAKSKLCEYIEIRISDDEVDPDELNSEKRMEETSQIKDSQGREVNEVHVGFETRRQRTLFSLFCRSKPHVVCVSAFLFFVFDSGECEGFDHKLNKIHKGWERLRECKSYTIPLFLSKEKELEMYSFCKEPTKQFYDPTWSITRPASDTLSTFALFINQETLVNVLNKFLSSPPSNLYLNPSQITSFQQLYEQLLFKKQERFEEI
jgi:hypothetical protein